MIRYITAQMLSQQEPKMFQRQYNFKCEKCGKISTTNVLSWDGKEVEYECRVDGLDWTKGLKRRVRLVNWPDGGARPQ